MTSLSARVHQAVAVDRALARERGRDDGRVEVVAPARRVDDADVGVGKGGADTRADVVGGHVLLRFRCVYSTQAPFLSAVYSSIA